MKSAKLQQDIIKAADRRDLDQTGETKIPYMYALNEDRFPGQIGILVNGCYIVIVPQSRFYLNVIRTFDTLAKDLDKLLGHPEYETYPLWDTGTLKTYPRGHRAKVLHSEAGDEILIDMNSLKYFDGLDDEDAVTYRGTKKNKPVYVYEWGVLVGMVLPINY